LFNLLESCLDTGGIRYVSADADCLASRSIDFLYNVFVVVRVSSEKSNGVGFCELYTFASASGAYGK